jgi:hypothetical protein
MFVLLSQSAWDKQWSFWTNVWQTYTVMYKMEASAQITPNIFRTVLVNNGPEICTH